MELYQAKRCHVKLRFVNNFSPDPLEALDCLCDLAILEAQVNPAPQASQAVPGLLSLPLAQEHQRNTTLPSLLFDLENLLHQLDPLEKN